jgi:hypothetical protein
MNGSFKAASAAMLITECINAADAIPVSVNPGNPDADPACHHFAVAVSLAAEFLYAYVEEIRDGGMGTRDVREHHEIVALWVVSSLNRLEMTHKPI